MKTLTIQLSDSVKNTYIIACHTTLSHSIESANSDADDLKIEEGNLPYSGLISRGEIFEVFADFASSTKFKPRKF